MNYSKNKKVHVVNGVTYTSIKEVAEALELNESSLVKAYTKYKDIEFAVAYVERLNKNINRSHNRVYKARGKTFKSIDDLCGYFKISYYTFNIHLKGCKNPDDVLDKIYELKKEPGYTVDGVFYKTIKEIEEVYKIPHSRLLLAHGKFQDINKALDYVMNHDYEEGTRKAREKFSYSSNRMFKSKRKFKLWMAHSTHSKYLVLKVRKGIHRYARRK